MMSGLLIYFPFNIIFHFLHGIKTDLIPLRDFGRLGGISDSFLTSRILPLGRHLRIFSLLLSIPLCQLSQGL